MAVTPRDRLAARAAFHIPSPTELANKVAKVPAPWTLAKRGAKALGYDKSGSPIGKLEKHFRGGSSFPASQPPNPRLVKTPTSQIARPRARKRGIGVPGR